SLLSLLRMTPRPPRSPLFPYTTLFRSLRAESRDLSEVLLRVAVVQQRLPRVRIEPDQLAQVLPEGPDSHAVSAQQRHGLAQLRHRAELRGLVQDEERRALRFPAPMRERGD